MSTYSRTRCFHCETAAAANVTATKIAGNDRGFFAAIATAKPSTTARRQAQILDRDETAESLACKVERYTAWIRENRERIAVLAPALVMGLAPSTCVSWFLAALNGTGLKRAGQAKFVGIYSSWHRSVLSVSIGRAVQPAPPFYFTPSDH